MTDGDGDGDDDMVGIPLPRSPTCGTDRFAPVVVFVFELLDVDVSSLVDDIRLSLLSLLLSAAFTAALAPFGILVGICLAVLFMETVGISISSSASSPTELLVEVLFSLLLPSLTRKDLEVKEAELLEEVLLLLHVVLVLLVV